jgi:hypothetical protein
MSDSVFVDPEQRRPDFPPYTQANPEHRDPDHRAKQRRPDVPPHTQADCEWMHYSITRYLWYLFVRVLYRRYSLWITDPGPWSVLSVIHMIIYC